MASPPMTKTHGYSAPACLPAPGLHRAQVGIRPCHGLTGMDRTPGANLAGRGGGENRGPVWDGHQPAPGRERQKVHWRGYIMSTTGTTMGRENKIAGGSKPQLHVLLVEDDAADRDLILRELSKGEFEIITEVVQTAEEFRHKVRAHCPDVVLSDYNLGQWRGTEALEILREEGLDIPLILVSGALGDVTAVECIKQGVTDYVLKDSLARLSVALRGALKDKKAREERKRAQDSLAQKVEELARSNADLEQFAYVASHDLQEPLRMVAAYTQLLAERYRGKLDAQADKYINYAVDGAARMQSLIHDLLAFSRVGRQETELKDTDCDQVVLQAVNDLHTAILESGAVITRETLPWLE